MLVLCFCGWWRFVNLCARVDSPFHLSFAIQRGTDEGATKCPALSWCWCSPSSTVRSFRQPLVDEELPSSSRYDCNRGRVHVVTLPNLLCWLAHVIPTKITFHAVVLLVVDAQNDDGDTVLHWTVRTGEWIWFGFRLRMDAVLQSSSITILSVPLMFVPMAFIWRHLSWQLR